MKVNWRLQDTIFTKNKGKVFSCFACGGGSTMGYKLAGYDVVGCNEIDKKLMAMYIENHSPKYSFLEPIQKFKDRNDLPSELYNLDILDGSPPCSTFSMAGQREKNWGKVKKFREGQQEQVLDTLFFDFIELAKKLQPKVVVAENVRGLLLGNAKKYMQRIHEEFDKAGYYCRYFLLDAAKMDVPQHRRRVFFICLRKDLASQFLADVDFFTKIPKIEMAFTGREIAFKEIEDTGNFEYPLYPSYKECWEQRKWGESDLSNAALRATGVYKFFTTNYAYRFGCIKTITTNVTANVSFHEPRFLNSVEVIRASTFPQDYNFCGNNVHYVCGMSVPPYMMYHVAKNIYNQWLSKL